MTEVWRTCVGFDLYEVSNTGKVRSLKYRNTDSTKIMTPGKNQLGYMKVRMTGPCGPVNRYVHSLVAEAWVANPFGKPEVNHIDGNPSNNLPENLEWVTSQENKVHARDVLGAVHGKPPVPVLAIKLTTGVRTAFKSISDAVRALSLKRSNVYLNLRGRRPSVGGYLIQYVKDQTCL